MVKKLLTIEDLLAKKGWQQDEVKRVYLHILDGELEVHQGDAGSPVRNDLRLLPHPAQ